MTKRIFQFLLTIVCAIGIVATPVKAEMSAREAILHKNEEKVQILIRGIKIGLEWADVEIVDTLHIDMFCVPMKLVINTDNAFDILERHVARHPTLADKAVGLVLLDAWKETFPCEKNN
jgi:hypothetical protein